MELLFKIAIGQIPKIGGVLARRLIAYTGSVEAVFAEKKKNLLKIPGIGEILVNQITNNNALQRAGKELEFIDKHGIETYFFLDRNYPSRLKQCEDAPLLLFKKGKADIDQAKMISMVGTRNATEYGRNMCESLIEGLSRHHNDVVIVSGLAYGIDAYAHRDALKNKMDTIAVLGHGLNTLYPSQHKSLARQIIDQGALVTDFLSDETPERNNFVKRNRIIAGISDATIVVESGLKGGALITADIANSYNRDVFACPGKSTDSYSVGCNKLIKTNKAALIESVEDLEYILGWEKAGQEPVQQKMFDMVSDEEKGILRYLSEHKSGSIDMISRELELTNSQLAAVLLNLELQGCIKSLPGNIYQLK
ncbi:MAG: DNA-protecting protein DprA [Bacteroidetes bacterium]|jgi:DNA processing protein|nr:DNA-protecting protein DprA [Bacteroidota bacterium]